MKFANTVLAFAAGVASFAAVAASPRVISVNYADKEKRAIMADADCVGELVAVGKAAGWNNILARGTNENLVVWDGSTATVDPALTVVSTGSDGPRQPNTDKPYPSLFQNAHLRGANITVSNVPFERYDVYLYYAARYFNSYGYFGTAKVNGTDWTYEYTGDGTTDVGYMVRGNKVWTTYQINGTYVYSIAEAPQLGHNVLIVKGETSSTLTLAKGTAGYFDIAAFQIAENPIPVFAPAGDTTVSAINTAAVAGDDMLRVTLADGATLTVDAALSDGLSKVFVTSAGAIRIDANGVTDAQLAAVLAKLDTSKVAGGVSYGWGKRVISVNFTDSWALMEGDQADGSLAGLGIPASSWTNILSTGSSPAKGVKMWNGARGATESLDDATVEYSGTFYHANDYPEPFQLRHLEWPTITMTGVPFARYDVILYYAVQYTNESYGYFSAAEVNGVNWTWDTTTSNMVQGAKGKWNDCINHKAAPQIGLNALRIDKQTSSTLTLKNAQGSGSGGQFYIAAFQIVENPVPEFAPTGDTTVSAINAAAVAGDDMLTVKLADGATLTVDAVLSDGLSKVFVTSAGAVRLVADGVTDEQLATVVAKLDASRVEGGVTYGWGKRVISVNFATTGNAKSQMTGDAADGSLAGVGIPASSWKNVYDNAEKKATGLTLWDGTTGTASPLDDAAVDFAGSGAFWEGHYDLYPRNFQKYHLEGAKITTTGIPFLRYDVILYYSVGYTGDSGRFEAAMVNGATWTWDGEKMVRASKPEKWNDPDNHRAAPQIGLNTLRIDGETSPTLKLNGIGVWGGKFYIAGYQLVERPVKELTPEGNIALSEINAAAPADDDVIAVRLADGATLTVDTNVVASLKKVILVSAGNVKIEKTADITDERRDAVVQALDATRVAGKVECGWGGRVISINFSNNGDSHLVRYDADCDGELAKVGRAEGWNNVSAVGSNGLVVWNWNRATSNETLVAESAGTIGHPHQSQPYPSVFQNAHLQGADITVSNIPFRRYDVIIYYSARYFNNYGWFGTAKVNGTDWVYKYTGDGTTDVGEMENGNYVWTDYSINSTKIYSIAEAPQLGHNALIVRRENSPTLTLAKGTAGYFDIAAVQIVEVVAPPKNGMILYVK